MRGIIKLVAIGFILFLALLITVLSTGNTFSQRCEALMDDKEKCIEQLRRGNINRNIVLHRHFRIRK